MKTNLAVDVICNKGRLQLTQQGMLQVMAPFGRMIWSVVGVQVTGFTTHPGSIGAINITVYVGQAKYQVDTVARPNFAKLMVYFPHLTVDSIPDNAWYHDTSKRVYVATYRNEKLMRNEVEQAIQNGWQIQAQSGAAGHINVGPTVTAAVLTGGWSLLLGASRTKDSVTFTFLRTSEWLTQNKTNP